MALHHTAQGLASLGRYGDSVLVHMQPQEVAGLQALAKSQGTSLSINPATGMPEAFNLGSFFSSFLPMFAGMALGPVGGIAPLLAGAATGAGLAAAKGENVLMGGLMGGLGGYGGGGLSTSLGAAANVPGAAGGAGAVGAIPSAGVVGSTGEMGSNLLTASKGIAPGAMSATANAIAPAYNFADTAVNTGLLQAGNVNPALVNAQNLVNASGLGAGSAASGASAFNPMDTLSKSFTGLKNISGFGDANANAAMEAFKAAGGSGMQIGMPVGGAVLSGLEPSDLGLGGPSMDDVRKRPKYRGPEGQLNLNSIYNQETGEYEGLPSLRLAAGGSVDLNPSVGGGLSDLYNRPEGATTLPISKDDYGMGRLDRLAQQGSLTKAADMFYAAGGPVSFADGGDTESSMNLDSLPSLNLNQIGASSEDSDSYNPTVGGMPNWNPVTNLKPSDDLNVNISVGGMPMPNSGLNSLRDQFFTSFGFSKQGSSEPKSYALNLNSGKQEPQASFSAPVASAASYQGDNNTPYMARGGYLNGPGDGLSDSIPATIEGKQPARLADGEFVVSADVVSGLGNGSSKAGAKKLYAMMDKVRQQAHGTKKQIKKVNASKVMPRA